LPTLLTAGHDHAPGERPWSIDVQGQLETHAETPATPAEVDLTDPALYLNRELSWLEFNQRVLEEAHDQRNLLLDRLKFLAITASNLDEFYGKRVGWLRRGIRSGGAVPPLMASPASSFTLSCSAASP
jgi:polyphosphate kinase